MEKSDDPVVARNCFIILAPFPFIPSLRWGIFVSVNLYLRQALALILTLTVSTLTLSLSDKSDPLSF